MVVVAGVTTTVGAGLHDVKEEWEVCQEKVGGFSLHDSVT